MRKSRFTEAQKAALIVRINVRVLCKHPAWTAAMRP
jgi:hypothetical protein